MVHGQAIGIPFRRRKGEQAPPPPKEVAWNPTILNNWSLYFLIAIMKYITFPTANLNEIIDLNNPIFIQ